MNEVLRRLQELIDKTSEKEVIGFIDTALEELQPQRKPKSRSMQDIIARNKGRFPLVVRWSGGQGSQRLLVLGWGTHYDEGSVVACNSKGEFREYSLKGKRWVMSEDLSEFRIMGRSPRDQVFHLFGSYVFEHNGKRSESPEYKFMMMSKDARREFFETLAAHERSIGEKSFGDEIAGLG